MTSRIECLPSNCLPTIRLAEIQAALDSPFQLQQSMTSADFMLSIMRLIEWWLRSQEPLTLKR
jgi:hypothetical protein